MKGKAALVLPGDAVVEGSCQVGRGSQFQEEDQLC